MTIIILIVLFILLWLFANKRDALLSWWLRWDKGRTLCPACHQRVEPCNMEDGDVMKIYSKDTYFLREWKCQTLIGHILSICPNCQYVIDER